LMDTRWLMPLLDLSVRCLPRAYAGVDASGDVSITLQVTADPKAVWTVRHVEASGFNGSTRMRQGGAWSVCRGASAAPTTTVRLDPETAWRMFYNALTPDVARQRAIVDGDAVFAEPLFRARAVMA
jgi:hypothetical protein